MPLRMSTVTEHFRDEDGNVVEDATFTIRKRLSHEAQMDYLQSAAKFEIDPVSGEVKTSMSELQLKRMTDIMLRDALVSWTGVEDAAGKPVPIEQANTADAVIVAQVTQAIQLLNRPSGQEDAGPKGDAPSASSSRGRRTRR